MGQTVRLVPFHQRDLPQTNVLRVDCSQDGVHAPLRAGIHGTADSGAYSIVMSGGYEDDEDYGDTL
jgi:hypothetical protein